MPTVDQAQIAAARAANPENGRDSISGLIVSDGDVIATDGHMLVRVERLDPDIKAPDAAKVLADAKLAATHTSVTVDPAKLAHLLRVLLAAAKVGPTVDEVKVPLDEVPADSGSPAFTNR